MPLHGRDIRLIVLDRDGTLNADPEDFIRAPEDWQPLPGALEAVARLNQAGWRVVIASNQSGLGRGLFDMATMNAVHDRMYKLMAQAGARVEAVFFCPHATEDDCDCRKPKPGLFHQISQRFGVPLPQIVAAGDSVRDAQAASAAGCQTHLVLTGQSQSYSVKQPPPELPPGVSVHANLGALAEALLTNNSN